MNSIDIDSPTSSNTIRSALKAQIRRSLALVASGVLPRLPLRLLVKSSIFVQQYKLPGQNALLRHLNSAARNHFHYNPDLPLLTDREKRRTGALATLYGMGRFEDVLSLIKDQAPALRSKASTLLMAYALFDLGEFERARTTLTDSGADEAFDFHPPTAHLRGILELLAGNEDAADLALRAAAEDMPHLQRPHQNLAAKDVSTYLPTRLDKVSGRDGRFFDAYNYLGQRVTHVGAGQLSTALYTKAMAAQKRLRQKPPRMSAVCAAYLEDLNIPLAELVIFGPEWTAQIGHLGMLDVHLRMRDLGWWSGTPILLVSHNRVANFAFLSLVAGRVKALSVGRTIPVDVAKELVSLQRYYGASFNAIEMPDGTVTQWSEAAAAAHVQWEAENRPPPLRAEYDNRLKSNETLAATVNRARSEWGMAPDDWYVCLHLRDAAYYGEINGFGQTHRNSSAESYRAAIEFITGLGGWVIKLGGERSLKLPKMQRVIDYSRSAFKSGPMDVCLIGDARLFIGTTSGLTNVAISLGTPAALVNCISSDAQLWHRKVRFIPKKIELNNGSMLTQAHLTRTPWRWRVYDAAVMRRFGASLIDNTADEVLETVKEVMAIATGKEYCPAGAEEGDDLMLRWRRSLSLPHYYGAAQISLHYLVKHAVSFLSPEEPRESLQVAAGAHPGASTTRSTLADVSRSRSRA